MKKILSFALIFSLIFAFSYDCKRKPIMPRVKIDHFKVYKVDTSAVVPLPIPITLRDQFDIAKQPTAISFFEYFANPVSKNGQRIIDSTAHFTWYRLLDNNPVIPRMVRVTNQFGMFKWKLGKAVYLLVPTHKIEIGSQFPEKLDHYKCYEVLAVAVEQRRVTLVDQFDKKLGREEKVTVDRPLFFAVPVMKNEKEIINKVDHLACYHITPLPSPTPPRPMEVSYKNQFGQGSLTTRESYMLCVPSTKVILKEGEE